MSGGCGAEVSGVNLSKPMEKEEKKLLEEAWLEYQVLFFRNQPLTPQQHVDFAKGFGELQGPGYMPTLDDYPNVYVQNILISLKALFQMLIGILMPHS